VAFPERPLSLQTAKHGYELHVFEEYKIWEVSRRVFYYRGTVLGTRRYLDQYLMLKVGADQERYLYCTHGVSRGDHNMRY